MADYQFSIADGVAKHFTIAGQDQFGRAFPLTSPAVFTGNDAQTVADANGLGFTTTLAVGGMSAFTVAEGSVSASVEIDSPAAVLTKLVVTEDA